MSEISSLYTTADTEKFLPFSLTFSPAEVVCVGKTF